MTTLTEWIKQGPYQAYTYAYPHKSSYRQLEPARELREVWSGEGLDSLFLYFHIPFCEMRCGFCNLFTLAKAKEDLQDAYLAALERQVQVVVDQLPTANFTRLAVGGGTPTLLSEAQLERLFNAIERVSSPSRIPVSVEMSPETINPTKLKILKDRGVNRASIGIQSFLEDETKAVRRAQKPAEAHQALDMMRSAGFDILNLDLIYGMGGQTNESFEFSIREAIKHAPEEVYLYPLYVRPLTGLGKADLSWDDHRMGLYLHGRDFLLANGYEQVSMRMFRRTGSSLVEGPVYCCQADGMLGLGVGARSYTNDLHYSTEYAVGRGTVKSIIDDFVERTPEELGTVSYGFELDREEQKRRHLILSLLSDEGLSDSLYAERFKSQPFDDFPELVSLIELELATKADELLRLTPRGFAWTDAIGPWLYSSRVNTLSAEFELR